MKCQCYEPSNLILLNSITDIHTRNVQAFIKNVGEAVANPTQLNNLKGNLNLHLYPFPITLDTQNIE